MYGAEQGVSKTAERQIRVYDGERGGRR
jgi:hypothetical protein